MDDFEYKYKIGYIDEQESFIDEFKRRLGDYFEIVTYDLNSDITVSILVQQIYDSKIDCLIVDYDLKETKVVTFNGWDIVSAIKEKTPFFPMFIITAQDENMVISNVEDNDIVRLKSELKEKTLIIKNRIQNKIIHYNNQINQAHTTIKELAVKQLDQTISLQEEEVLSDMYIFLEKINPDSKVLPDSLMQPNSIKKLDEFVSNTHKILEILEELS